LSSAGVIMLIIATALVFGPLDDGLRHPRRLVDFVAYQGFHTW
jgi:hypothetical protein